MLQDKNHLLHTFARLLSYPEDDYQMRAAELVRAFENDQNQRKQLLPFYDFIRTASPGKIEEIFTRTFDMNKTTCLEIGWHLYGEDYKRGEFLVRMRQSLAEYKIPESIELPDHISHCLLLLAALDEEDAPVYAERFLKPTLKIILKNFDKANPFRPLVEALQNYLSENDFFTPDTVLPMGDEYLNC